MKFCWEDWVLLYLTVLLNRRSFWIENFCRRGKGRNFSKDNFQWILCVENDYTSRDILSIVSNLLLILTHVCSHKLFFFFFFSEALDRYKTHVITPIITFDSRFELSSQSNDCLSGIAPVHRSFVRQTWRRGEGREGGGEKSEIEGNSVETLVEERNDVAQIRGSWIKSREIGGNLRLK